MGRNVATAQDARRIMKVGVSYDSIDETLQNLGLPPNRATGEPGFMVWETDGKKGVADTMSDSHPMAYCMVPPGNGDAAAEAAGGPVLGAP